MMRALVLLAASAILGACTALSEKLAAPFESASATASATGSSTAEDLVAYLGRLRTMNDAALTAEAARQRRETSDLAKVKAALALTLVAQSEENEIVALVDAPAKSADGDLRAMAAFLHALATDRRRLKESAASAGARLRDERRAFEAQKQRAEALQQKLDAMAELEKSLSERQNPTR